MLVRPVGQGREGIGHWGRNAGAIRKVFVFVEASLDEIRGDAILPRRFVPLHPFEGVPDGRIVELVVQGGEWSGTWRGV